MGLISNYILPKNVDFDNALQSQAHITRTIVEDLQAACRDNNRALLKHIAEHATEARALKSSNMKELLDVFITSYDKESIYRMITQLDWIALSVRHFALEVQSYEVASLDQYQVIADVLGEMAVLLELGITRLSVKNPKAIAPDIDLIHDKYDQVVKLCAQAVAQLLDQEDCKRILVHKEVLAQLKEVAKRIHVTANTLEDMAIKII